MLDTPNLLNILPRIQIDSMPKTSKVKKKVKKENINIKFNLLKLNNKRKIEAKKIDTNELKNKIIEKKKTDIFNLYSQSRLSKLKNNSYIQY